MGQRFITSRRIGIRDQTGETRYLINVVDDVTDRRRADDKIAHLAHYDALTDLPNRVLFREQIERELQRTSRGEQFALLYIDVDEFKGINDSLGHHVGDELLKGVAGRIRSCIKETDLIARLGGDEFAVIQTGVRDVSDVVEFVTRIHEAIRQPYQCLGHQLSTDASIGIALAPRDGTDLDQLVKNADLAMYGAKAGGRRTYRFFEPAMDASAKARLAMEQDLRQALLEGGFEIHYQPVVDLRSDKVTGCEALLRWRHPQRGMISPAEFIPVAEDTGLIVELGEWVLRTACAEAASWPEHVRVAVNVSPVQLKCPTLALKIMGALAASGLQANRLEIEITEAVLIRDDEAALAILHQLARHRRAHRAGRFRHRLFLAELSQALSARQDQDRSLLHQRHHGNRRLVGDRAGGGEHRDLLQHDDDGGRRRNIGAEGTASRAGLHRDAGLPVQRRQTRSGGQAPVRHARRDGGGRGLTSLPCGQDRSGVAVAARPQFSARGGRMSPAISRLTDRVFFKPAP